MAAHCLLTVCLVLFLISTAQAQQQVYDINLPAQTVAKSLNSLSEQTGIPVLFPYDLAGNRRAKPVAGHYTLLQALDILLEGTGLSGGLSDKGVLMISPVESATPNDRGKDMKRENGFFSKLIVSLAAILTAPAGMAQGGAGQAKGALEEIVVTAQKREQSIQDVGMAITALGQDRLVDAQVQNIQDLQGMAPGLTLGESFGFAQIMVRGIGTDNPFAGGDPSVAMHVDGVVTGQSSAQLGSLFDIQRIEVLRGPQGTLYGRNNTGGSINVITNKPTEDVSGYGRFTVGNHELFQFDGAVSGPLSEQLLGRLAVKIVERGGYGENLFNGDQIDANYAIKPVEGVVSVFVKPFGLGGQGRKIRGPLGIPAAPDRVLHLKPPTGVRLDRAVFGRGVDVHTRPILLVDHFPLFDDHHPIRA